MIYQIFYDYQSLQQVNNHKGLIRPFGVHLARQQERRADYLYDDEKIPNLTEHNTLCEWRVLYYVWKHHPSEWVGFTSWRHDFKNFSPQIEHIDMPWVLSALKMFPIAGFAVRPLKELIVKNVVPYEEATLKSQFLQWSWIENKLGVRINDMRQMPMARFHSETYWNFVMQQFQSLYGVNLEKELDWDALGKIDKLHTWCNAFVARWAYFDDYMSTFSPIVLNMLDHFGSHPKDLELSYICERLIILHNYIRHANNRSHRGDIPPMLMKAPDNAISVKSRATGISIITCSCDNQKFSSFKENIASILGDEIQIIRIQDAKSIGEGYHRGVAQATGEFIIFCHDDIHILNDDLPEIIREDLKHYDIVGVAGASRIVEGNWISSGHPYVHGQVAHVIKGAPNKYQLSVYGLGRDSTIVKGIQALDGVFIAVRRSVLDKVRFDHRSFDGFHLFDLDFSSSAFLKGFRMVVDHRIHILHQSMGKFDDVWALYFDRFNSKFATTLSSRKNDMTCMIKGIEFGTKRELSDEMKRHEKFHRIILSRQRNGQCHRYGIIMDSSGLMRPVHSSLNSHPAIKDNSVGYLRVDFAIVQELLLSEIFRVCTHGAIIEFDLDPCRFEKAVIAGTSGANMVDLYDRCPPMIKFTKDHTDSGAMICQAALNAKGNSKNLYFQVEKRHAAC